MIGLAAALLGGANVQPAETRDWGIFFGLDFFIVKLLVTGFMFAPLERAFPHRRTQRLFRTEWRADLFYYLVSKIGSASCRARVCQYVSIQVVAVSLPTTRRHTN